MDGAALRLLVEHTWPGNDLELESLLVRAVRITRGLAITPEELGAVGFEPKSAPRSEPTPMAPSTRRRAPRRWARK